MLFKLYKMQHHSLIFSLKTSIHPFTWKIKYSILEPSVALRTTGNSVHFLQGYVLIQEEIINLGNNNKI
jgi:hypothetical protein